MNWHLKLGPRKKAVIQIFNEWLKLILSKLAIKWGKKKYDTVGTIKKSNKKIV